jgi:hypothetical protein
LPSPAPLPSLKIEVILFLVVFMTCLRSLACALLCLALAIPAFSQNTAPTAPSPAPQPPLSLAEQARKLRKDRPAEVKMNDEETKELFRAVDKIFDFASEDTGYPKHGAVKRQMVGPADIEQFTKEYLAKAEYSQRFARAELTMKKFGLLPREFDLKDFLVKSNGKQIAGLYRWDTKTISLLNTVSLENQGPILAHELTHALQDQNFDLKTWQQPTGKGSEMTDETSTARRAIVEGQAMVVYIDFVLAPAGRSLLNTPGILASMEEPVVQASIDTEMLHNAPMVLREAGAFPYRDGLIFEAEILEKAGKQAAFAGIFARPPRNTHEVFDPKAYLEHAKLASVAIPDVHALLANQYEVYDSGSFGELDVRSLLHQFGDRRTSTELASNWEGGTYVAFKKTQTSTPQPSTGDLALIYVSHWKNAQAAEKFARFYATTVARRYPGATVDAVPACAAAPCPTGAASISTNEGPVIVEDWPDNTVIVSESFDSTLAAKLSSAIRTAPADQRASTGKPAEINKPTSADNSKTVAQAANQNEASNPNNAGDKDRPSNADDTLDEELSMRLYSMPAFRVFEEQLGNELLNQVVDTISAPK